HPASEPISRIRTESRRARRGRMLGATTRNTRGILRRSNDADDLAPPPNRRERFLRWALVLCIRRLAHLVPRRPACPGCVLVFVVVVAPASGEPVEGGIKRRHEEEGEHGGYREPTDDGPRERQVRLAAFADTERHRHEAYDRGDRRHQNGTQPSAGCLDRRLEHGLAS